MYTINVVVESMGARGLLMHRFPVEESAAMESAVKKTNRKNVPREEEAEAAAYRLESGMKGKLGQLALPAEHFLGALTAAGSNYAVKGRGKATHKATFKGAIDITPDLIGLTAPDGTILYSYEIDSRAVRIKATGGRIIRNRPHIKVWRAKFVITVSDDSIDYDVVRAALVDAGQSKCVGDYRPRFGQFGIVHFEREGTKTKVA